MVSNLNFCFYTPAWYIKIDGFSVYTLERYIYAARLIWNSVVKDKVWHVYVVLSITKSFVASRSMLYKTMHLFYYQTTLHFKVFAQIISLAF